MDLTLVLTDACQLRCDYCYAAPRSCRTMSHATMQSAIELAFSHPQQGQKSQARLLFLAANRS